MKEKKMSPLKPEERKFTYAQSMQLESQMGCIGHLRGDFGSSGNEFWTTWFDVNKEWKTDEFKSDLDDVINALRKDGRLLHNRRDMTVFAVKYPESIFEGTYREVYGFRVDTENYSFLLRCCPAKGDYNFYCYGYVKKWLDRYIVNNS